jgi:predicted MFS family arabinose efflux permease
VTIDATDVQAAAVALDVDGLPRTRRRRLLTTLSITQTVGYGVLYYAFAVVLTPIAADLHTSTTAVTGALAVCVIVTGLAGIPVGRWIDRRGARALMTAGSLTGGLAVAAWSQIHTVAELYAVFAVIGLASAMTLYEPAFAVVIRSVAPARRSGALLTVTIVAGFASSIFLPLTGVLTAHLGWRHALLALAAVHLAVTVPLHATAVPPDQRITPTTATATVNQGRPVVRRALRDRRFWLFLAGFTAQGAATTVIGVLLVAYLIRLGHPPALAATIAGLLGVLSVTGRLATTGLHRRHSIARITAAVFVLQALGIAVLPILGTSTIGAIGCVIVFGLGFGVATIARPALLADRYGTTAYATVAGTMSTPINVAKAIAPLAAAAIASSGAGYTAVMAAVAACCALAAASLVLAA